MNIKFLLFFFFFFSLFAKSNVNYSRQNMDSVLQVLDDVIETKQYYTNLKKSKINDLKRLIDLGRDDNERFDQLGSLFDELKNFQMDSALIVAERRIEIASKMGSKQKMIFAQMNIAEVMIVTGMYKEALDILDSLDRTNFESVEEFRIMYHLYHTLYILMSEYSFLELQKDSYNNLMLSYKDSILSVLPNSSVEYRLVEISKLIANNQYDQALQISRFILDTDVDEHTIAMLMHDLSDIYRAENDIEKLKYVLAISAVNDIKSGVKEYMSLPELASLLFEEQDIDRAYNYIKCSLDDAIYCKARLRTIQLSQTVPLISAAYEAKISVENKRLLIATCISIVLILILFFSLFYIYKKLKELASYRRSLRNINKELHNTNTNLKELNEQLIESNKVKEEYIGYVFSICSDYIEKLDSFRKRVNRLIKGGMVKDLYEQTKSTSLVTDELKELYTNFDTIFLSIFPDFIEDLNALLLDDEKIYPKDGELLTPELRIFALIRLGINDSSKIASLLHYSVQTVYNYRLRVRNKARIDKNEFMDAIQSLGRRSK